MDLKTYKVEIAFPEVIDAGEAWAELGVVMASTEEDAIKRAGLSDRTIDGAVFRVTELDTTTLSDIGGIAPPPTHGKSVPRRTTQKNTRRKRPWS